MKIRATVQVAIYFIGNASCQFVKFVGKKRVSLAKKIRGQLKKFVDPKSKYIMKLDTALYARLLREAADNPRLRQATDLRTSPADQSQRMLNALLPGTAVPVHRHPHSAETAVVLSGCLQINFSLSGSGLRSAFFA